jgi:hypothetical protein
VHDDSMSSYRRSGYRDEILTQCQTHDGRHAPTYDAKIVSFSSGMDRCRPIPGVAQYMQFQ